LKNPLTGLFRPRDKPGRRAARNSLSGGSYAFFFGGTTSGKVVNERSAMQMTAAYACVRILAEAIASLPLHVYRYSDTGDPSRAGSKEKAVQHPLYNILHDEPNPEMSSFSFRETLMTHLLLWGNAYAQVLRNGRGEVLALYPLMPDRMTVDRDTAGRIYYEPTIFGTRAGLQGVGEAGPEAILPLDTLWTEMSDRLKAGMREILAEAQTEREQRAAQLVSAVAAALKTTGSEKSGGIVVTQNIYAEETSYVGQQREAARQFKQIARALT